MLLSQLRHGDPDLGWCISSSTGITYREWAPGAKVCILLSLGCFNYSSTLVALFPIYVSLVSCISCIFDKVQMFSI